MISIPEKCKFIFEIFLNAGFKCYAVGGCIRDSLMGRTPVDWDFTTDASPSDIESCFHEYKTINIGKNYGTITVVVGDDSYEITTFRCDGDYTDSRHPDSVLFTKSITEDLIRRDFTMNSIAFSPFEGLIDPFDGYSDIKNKIIRCTGDPALRFKEDAIRILRGLRFGSSLSFDIEPETRKNIFISAGLLSKVHPARLRKELSGLLLGDNAVNILNEYREVLAVIIPEIKYMFDLKQNNPHHIYDVWSHTLKAFENTKNTELHRLSVLFHDIGKPWLKTTDSDGTDHFKKHQMKSAEIAESVLKRFGYPSALISDITLLIKFHDERFRNLRYDVRRMLGLLGERLFFVLTDIIYADISGQSDYKKNEKLKHRELVISTAQKIIDSGECCSLSGLSIDGLDLVSLGFSGPLIGKILNTLLELVLKDKLHNNKEALLNYVNKTF